MARIGRGPPATCGIGWPIGILLLAGALMTSCSQTSAQPPASTGAASPPAETATTTGKAQHHHKPRKRHRPARHHHPARVRMAGVPAADVPNRALTPGVALPVSAGQVCVSGYASRVRNVPGSEKDAVYARYDVAHVPYAHEVDHLISLELGGSNAIANLWPEPYAGRWGARTKDVLENRLHDLVCAGTLTLTDAQHIEATNWVAAYLRYVGAPPASTGGGSTGGPGSGGGDGSGSCTPGYAPCLVDHGGLDYDCYGGGGNGPYFTAPGVTYRVSGSDPYNLDGNHDGYGC